MPTHSTTTFLKFCVVYLCDPKLENRHLLFLFTTATIYKQLLLYYADFYFPIIYHGTQMKQLSVITSNPSKVLNKLRVFQKNHMLQGTDRQLIEDYLKLIGKQKIFTYYNLITNARLSIYLFIPSFQNGYKIVVFKIY